jgi:hypothetical protein
MREEMHFEVPSGEGVRRAKVDEALGKHVAATRRQLLCACQSFHLHLHPFSFSLSLLL